MENAAISCQRELAIAAAYDATERYGASPAVMGYLIQLGMVSETPSTESWGMEEFGDDMTFKTSLKDKVINAFKHLTGKADSQADQIDMLASGVTEKVDKEEVASKVESGVIAGVLAVGTSILVELNRLADIKPNELYDRGLLSLADKYRDRKTALMHQINTLDNDMKADVQRKQAIDAGKSKLVPALKAKVRNFAEGTKFTAAKVKNAGHLLFRSDIHQAMSTPRVVIMGVLLWGLYYVAIRILRWLKRNLTGE